MGKEEGTLEEGFDKSIDRKLLTAEQEDEKEKREHRLIEKEKEVIEEEYVYDIEETEDKLVDTLLLWLGFGFSMTAIVLFFANEFRLNNGIRALSIVGLLLLGIGIFYRFVYKVHLKKEKDKIDEDEEEIREWNEA
ncbi:hypothetical protein COV93_08555 [Candidatus Woesearchaeota archaeon CG11_big_fil_rev_8_21_14_0_20_43_8]|nr:MAG: hypothetical protein COV93_08555 [Candidatus Woesearchaeota archaeon CG11_big_fil_rev_8_21_14_0_20_43_8]PIO04725.1 MAG: hypothetical protein COT47_07800 [Candidatus Woesearchaeota archaeon CG08_land_8_20_14_0_20_43_7]